MASDCIGCWRKQSNRDGDKKTVQQHWNQSTMETLYFLFLGLIRIEKINKKLVSNYIFMWNCLVLVTGAHLAFSSVDCWLALISIRYYLVFNTNITLYPLILTQLIVSNANEMQLSNCIYFHRWWNHFDFIKYLWCKTSNEFVLKLVRNAMTFWIQKKIAGMIEKFVV